MNFYINVSILVKTIISNNVFLRLQTLIAVKMTSSITSIKNK